MFKSIFKYIGSFFLAGITGLLLSCSSGNEDIHGLAVDHAEDLRIGVYITAHAVDQVLNTEIGRREAVSLLRANGVTRVFIEVYRSGLCIHPDTLKSIVDFFRDMKFNVSGGIATVPGRNFGVRQEARYDWFNWEEKKTQSDLARVMRESAPLFDSFIVDDFLCTDDTSKISKIAKGTRDWAQYRRDLLTEISDSIFVRLPKHENPAIKMIIKFPQWYDRYHLFGYDVDRQTHIFDKVWIGTETRGQFTRRFGFVQPYEGFINYRWMLSIAGEKLSGAWFDHIDCDQNDFIDQAYQSVLAGAGELTLFNYFNLTEGHPGQHLLRMELSHLIDLAHQIARNPVTGIYSYKPANSHAGGDLYLMDYLGMIGIPVIPVAVFPEEIGKVIFLPTQAAADPEIINKVSRAIGSGVRVIVTTGFLLNASGGKELAELAGIRWPLASSPSEGTPVSETILQDTVVRPVEFESLMDVNHAIPLLELETNGKRIPYLVSSGDKKIFVLNSHTFSQADFDSAGEVLLCPRPIGLMDIPDDWANKIRNVFNEPIGLKLESPVRISCQPFGENEIMLQNYNQGPVIAKLDVDEKNDYYNVLDGKLIKKEGAVLEIDIPGRSKVWVKKWTDHH